MDNDTGSIIPFVTGVLPKDEYSDVNEFAKDLASVLRIDKDKIVVDLIALESLKGDQGPRGQRGLIGPIGPRGPEGPAGPTGPSTLCSYDVLAVVANIATWTLTNGIPHYNAKLTLTGANSLVIANAANGMSGNLILTQNVTGTGTLTLPANSKYVGGAISITSGSPSTIDILKWKYDGTTFFWTIDNDFS